MLNIQVKWICHNRLGTCFGCGRGLNLCICKVFLAYFPYFEKIKTDLWHLRVVCEPLSINFWDLKDNWDPSIYLKCNSVAPYIAHICNMQLDLSDCELFCSVWSWPVPSVPTVCDFTACPQTLTRVPYSYFMNYFMLEALVHHDWIANYWEGDSTPKAHITHLLIFMFV
jgi:hypothetical protein